MVLRLQLWAFAEDNELRIGIHSGNVELVTDINGQANICGDTAYRSLVGDRTKSLDDPRADFPAPTQVLAKHGWQIVVHPMRLLWPDDTDRSTHPEVYAYEPWKDNEPLFWDNSDPASKWHLSVTVADTRPFVDPDTGETVSVPDETWDQQRKLATRIAFVQLTGKNVYPALRAAVDEGAIGDQIPVELRMFRVYMPTDECVELMGSDLTGSADSVDTWADGWAQLLADIKKARPRAQVTLWRIPVMGFFGSYLDWDRPGGRIYMSPYIWGADSADCPGFDIVWQGETPPPPYEAFCEGLERLRDHPGVIPVKLPTPSPPDEA